MKRFFKKLGKISARLLETRFAEVMFTFGIAVGINYICKLTDNPSETFQIIVLYYLLRIKRNRNEKK